MDVEEIPTTGGRGTAPSSAGHDPARDDPARDDPASDDPASDDPASDDPASDDPARETPDGGGAPSTETCSLVGDTVILRGLVVDDPTVAAVLARLPTERWADTARRMLAIGARAMVETSVGVDLAAVDERVRRTIEQATNTAEATVRRIVADAERAVQTSLDPDTRTSVMARAIAELTAVGRAIDDTIDPDRTDSHLARTLATVAEMLGPGGPLEARLAAALDPTVDGSGLAVIRSEVDRRFSEIRDLLSEQRGRREEAQNGTRKGFEFEDSLEERLRLLARPLGAVVTRTSTTTGAVGDDLAGDFVLTLSDGTVVAIEAKNTGRIGLDGAGGILVELDRAMANRDAAFGICVSALDAFPAEVGPFGVYGNRILVVDDGDGALLEVAVRWVALMAGMSGRTGNRVDVDSIRSTADRIRRMAQTFSTHRRTLTDSIDSINRVRDGLDGMRRDLLAHLDDLEFELDRTPQFPLQVVAGR
jgi:hypothetical protein